MNILKWAFSPEYRDEIKRIKSETSLSGDELMKFKNLCEVIDKKLRTDIRFSLNHQIGKLYIFPEVTERISRISLSPSSPDVAFFNDFEVDLANYNGEINMVALEQRQKLWEILFSIDTCDCVPLTRKIKFATNREKERTVDLIIDLYEEVFMKKVNHDF